ncbi:MAG: diphthine synthase [Candidatus Hadarchaeales archaeon]
MLTFVGLGVGRGGISLRGLELARRADAVYAELYTSMLPEHDLGKIIGRPVRLVNRKFVEENPDEMIQEAKTKNVVFLVPGDPMVATTHVDLRLRAAKAGVETRVIPSASVLSAVPGLTGLQSYRFGPSATVPFPDNPSTRPYDVLADNLQRGLHTLLLLDIRTDEGRAMTIREAIEIMLGLEGSLQRGAFSEEMLAVGIARAGWDDQVVKADAVKALRAFDFGSPPHALVVPGRLHFLEAEALRVFAGAPEDLVR